MHSYTALLISVGFAAGGATVALEGRRVAVLLLRIVIAQLFPRGDVLPMSE
eukprot:COSAG03_NODE_5939_length_1144_cov_10.716010_2_plen_51_part_00